MTANIGVLHSKVGRRTTAVIRRFRTMTEKSKQNWFSLLLRLADATSPRVFQINERSRLERPLLPLASAPVEIRPTVAIKAGANFMYRSPSLKCY